MRATCGVNVLPKARLEMPMKVRGAYKSYKRFMTSFSIPSIAFSNSASDAFRHTSVSRIRVEMN